VLYGPPSMTTPSQEAILQAEVAAIGSLEIVPTILEVVCRTTGMGFAAVARVTEDRWIACAVKDDIEFGLKAGGELQVQTTICNEIRQHRELVAIDDVAEDETYRGHATPAKYGFRSYISVPIVLRNGDFFGTLCAIDPHPANVRAPGTIGMFRAFAELIAFHVQAQHRVDVAEADLLTEREASELREQFIAVLGHDLRNPLAAIMAGTSLLLRSPEQGTALRTVAMMQNSVRRMAGLIDVVMDFAKARLGAGLGVRRHAVGSLDRVLQQVVDELQVASPDRVLHLEVEITEPVNCDPARIAQLASNLIANAITHGSRGTPVRVAASTAAGALELSVANGGDPIPPAMQQRLFLPFVRASMQPDQQGLGLGLYIASEIARAHDGTLTVISDPRETRFTFRMSCGTA
jgi:signal transduction histidine kinase